MRSALPHDRIQGTEDANLTSFDRRINVSGPDSDLDKRLRGKILSSRVREWNQECNIQVCSKHHE